MNYFLVKSDPDTYGWNEFVKEKKTSWTGVRNYAARLHLRTMKKGDQVLFYHSGGESSIVGLAKVVKEAYTDPTSGDPQWSAVDLEAGKKFPIPVSLTAIKKIPALKNMLLLKISRLSVMPVTEDEFSVIVAESNKK